MNESYLSISELFFGSLEKNVIDWVSVVEVFKFGFELVVCYFIVSLWFEGYKDG